VVCHPQRQSEWAGKLYLPKTTAGIREGNIHRSLAGMLHDHLNGRRTGFVFGTAAGTPLARSNVLRKSWLRILGERGRERCNSMPFAGTMWLIFASKESRRTCCAYGSATPTVASRTVTRR
jgi:hypothetical protein